MRDVPSQEKPRGMNHTFLKITRWRNSRKNKISSISCHHIALITSFSTSQEFCTSDSIWESYANFSEDTQKLLHKISHFSPRVSKYQRENWLISKWNVWYSIYIGHGVKLVPQTGPTCNLQIIKFSFVWLAHPKRLGTPTSKIHISSKDDPHINGNGLTMTISLWWVYLQILGLRPLNSSICSGLQRFHT